MAAQRPGDDQYRAQRGRTERRLEYIGHRILVSIGNPGQSQNAGTVYAVTASRGALGGGAFSEIYGGESVNSGKVESGEKGGC